MNRNPKHAAPSDLLRTSMNTIILKVDRKTAKHCAFCRRSETHLEGKRFGFICILKHAIMDALTCPDFKDSRKPSELTALSRENPP